MLDDLEVRTFGLILVEEGMVLLMFPASLLEGVTGWLRTIVGVLLELETEGAGLVLITLEFPLVSNRLL